MITHPPMEDPNGMGWKPTEGAIVPPGWGRINFESEHSFYLRMALEWKRAAEERDAAAERAETEAERLREVKDHNTLLSAALERKDEEIEKLRSSYKAEVERLQAEVRYLAGNGDENDKEADGSVGFGHEGF